MNLKKHLHGRSWKTTTFGIIVILFGLVLFSIHWVPMVNGTFAELWFNIAYAEVGPICIMLVGIALILARDHSCTSAHIQERHEHLKRPQRRTVLGYALGYWDGRKDKQDHTE